LALALTEPPGQATHWTGRAMAVASGVSLRSVQRIWAAHRLQHRRVRRFKLSQYPAFATKLRDVVGLYLDPPAHSLVMSVDEKSQIPALDRTQPGAADEEASGRDDDPRLYWARVCRAQCTRRDRDRLAMARYRHQEFIPFLNGIEAAVPVGKLVHAILDNCAVHKHPEVCAGLARQPRWTFHFAPTSCSWANAVETFFATLTSRRLQRGVFRSLVDLLATINRFLGEHNRKPTPFVWTTDPDRIIAAVGAGTKRWIPELSRTVNPASSLLPVMTAVAISDDPRG
jgi:transposase